jgi:ceramide glucosyltransferase
MSFADLATGFCAASLACHFLSLCVAALRLRRTPAAEPWAEPAVSLLLPVCGLDNFAEETFASAFRLDYPNYELIFCVAQPDDPAVAPVRHLIEAHPDVPARLLIGDDRISRNPKLNNIVKGWEAARQPWIIAADSNVSLLPDYIRRLFSRWQLDTGAVCSMPIGARPYNFWAELECAVLNSLQARYQYAAESLGFGFAQGKTMLFRRELIERAGGIRALAIDNAEDAALTKIVRAAGFKVQLVDRPVEQPLGWRAVAQVWGRQLRWARLRRASFFWLFLPEIFAGSALPAAAAAFASPEYGINPALAAALVFASYIAGEMAFSASAGWHRSWRMPFALLLRDLMLPAVWLGALFGSDFVWRGNVMSATKGHGGNLRNEQLDHAVPSLRGS